MLLFRPLHNTARVFANRTAKEAAAVEKAKGKDLAFTDLAPYVSGKRGRQAEADNDPDGGIWSAGQTVGLVDDVPTVEELVNRMVAEAEATIRGRLLGLLSAKL